MKTLLPVATTCILTSHAFSLFGLPRYLKVKKKYIFFRQVGTSFFIQIMKTTSPLKAISLLGLDLLGYVKKYVFYRYVTQRVFRVLLG